MLDQFHTVRNLRSAFSILLLTAVILAGCSSSQPVQKDEQKPEAVKPEVPKEKKLPLSTYEATLNPANFDKEIEEVQKVQDEEKKPAAPLEIPKDSLIVQEEAVQGFRIQVFSSSNVDEATSMKNVTLEKFTGDSIYVVYDAPVYKVRVGDFVNRYEANQRLPEFVEKGYRDAWIVPDRVIQRKLVRIALPK
jgi:hypothetical protein